MPLFKLRLGNKKLISYKVLVKPVVVYVYIERLSKSDEIKLEMFEKKILKIILVRWESIKRNMK